MAVTNQELIIAGVLVGLVCLAVFNKEETTPAADSPAPSGSPGFAHVKTETKLEAERSRLDGRQGTIHYELRLWAARVEKFLQASGDPQDRRQIGP